MLYQPTVHILLATYNGAQYLAEQLASLQRQTYTRWSLTVSDDGSTDDSREIVQAFADKVPQSVHMLRGPRKGSTNNFFHLVQQAPNDQLQDLFAFCDQDDVWLDLKLEKAVQWHGSHVREPVRLYCGRTQFVNERLKPMGWSPGVQRLPSFGNALVQNIASGNTMVMSQALLTALKRINPENSVWHDWTTYLVATSLGGLVWFDNVFYVNYRQHAANVVGSNARPGENIVAFIESMRGRYRKRMNKNLDALAEISDCLPIQNRVILLQFAAIRNSRSIKERIRIWRCSPIRRQSQVSNIWLLIALISNRL